MCRKMYDNELYSKKQIDEFINLFVKTTPNNNR